MEIGMLWFDNDKNTSIPKKVEKAARYYLKKYGVTPDLCYVHPMMVNGKNGKKKSAKTKSKKDQMQIGTVLVLKDDKVLPDHFWIGVKTVKDRVS